ncbi:MAG: tRNA lysidine(34) synthetase TilS [Treponema sp.]|nr:tRNA lysidine(34) synthetase TilS [Treponema sp.]
MICEENSSEITHPLFPVSGYGAAEFENSVSSILLNRPPRTLFLAAVSGGADSIAMLCAISAVIPKERLCCLHVDHGIRSPEESSSDAVFVRDYCRSLGIECRVKSIPHGKITSFARRKKAGIEAAARFFRRKALFSEAAGLGENACILIAHTKDDMLETVLMRFLRGCGPAGLAAMSAEKKNSKEQAIILRPLLSVSREDVLCYLKAKGVSWREDSTNSDEKYLRNRIRRHLVPLLNEAFPSWKAGVSAMAQTQSLASDFIADEAGKRIQWDFEYRQPSGSPVHVHCISTNEENFFAQTQIIREESVFIALDKLLKGKNYIKSIKRSVIRNFCRGNIIASVLGPAQIRRKEGKVLLLRKQKEFFERGVSILI